MDTTAKCGFFSSWNAYIADSDVKPWFSLNAIDGGGGGGGSRNISNLFSFDKWKCSYSRYSNEFLFARGKMRGILRIKLHLINHTELSVCHLPCSSDNLFLRPMGLWHDIRKWAPFNRQTNSTLCTERNRMSKPCLCHGRFSNVIHSSQYVTPMTNDCRIHAEDEKEIVRQMEQIKMEIKFNRPKTFINSNTRTPTLDISKHIFRFSMQ